MTPKARAGRMRTTSPPEASGFGRLDAVTGSAKNAAVPLTPIDRSIGELLAAALVADLLAFPDPPAPVEG